MVSLPSLETLELQSVRFFSEETLQRLLSSCPILEDLLVDLRENDTRGKLTVAVPSLQSLSLYIPCDHDIDGYVIETPALKYFKLWDHNTKSHYYLIEHMPYLIDAHLDVRLPDIKSIIGSITSVKRLTICSPAMLEGFVFYQLEHLEVCICKEYSSNQLVRLLESSSTLQGLHLSLMDEHDGPEMVYWNQPTTVPECLLSSLQTLSWSFYKKTTRERYCGLHSETCSSLKDCNNRVISIVGCSKI
ncbi:RNI-like superfamily protein [Raphanus sativus]|nr:RNI-like superfamily protein [Raphanus sativus]